jgi:hypothetical protein
MRYAYNILVEKHERKRPIGRPRCRWEDKITINLKENTEGRSGLDTSGSV